MYKRVPDQGNVKTLLHCGMLLTAVWVLEIQTGRKTEIQKLCTDKEGKALV